MKTRYIVTTACAATIFALGLGQHTEAMMNPARTMKITFSQPVRLPGVGLDAGTYIFEVANPETSGDAVRVLSGDRKTAYFQGFSHRVQKPRGLRDDAAVSLSETRSGVAPAVTVWWPERTGYQFIYPNQ